MLINKQKVAVFTIFLMLGLFVVSCIGLLTDPRVITGSPAWLKPAKFSLSIAIYLGTLVWILQKVSIWPRLVSALSATSAAMAVIEIVIIDLQAWRGTTSHFNFRTNLDASLFGIMGVSIAVLWLASIGVAVALFRQKFADASFGWALRLGMVITVLGLASGGMMTRPMPGQKSGVVGAHTVGAPDGGRGLPVTNWSAEHGDLRIAHFFGLHAMQAIPLLYWLLARRRRVTPGLVAAVSASYAAAVALLEWQALRGQPVLQPDSTTALAWVAWLVLSVIFTLILSSRQERHVLPATAVAA